MINLAITSVSGKGEERVKNTELIQTSALCGLLRKYSSM